MELGALFIVTGKMIRVHRDVHCHLLYLVSKLNLKKVNNIQIQTRKLII